jgi:glutaredoxin 3
MKVIVYTKDNCPYCVKAKQLLSIKNVDYNEVVIGQDIIREDFMSLFPDVRTVPLIIIDNVKVGGYEQLREYIDNQPKFLAE